MKKIYFFLGFSFLTSTMFGQWQDLKSEEEITVDHREFPSFIQLLENDEIYSLYTFIERLSLSGLTGPSPMVSLNPDFDLSLKFKMYNGNFTNLSVPPSQYAPYSYNNSDDLTSNNNELYFGFRNSSAKLSVYKFDGSSWQSIGPVNVSLQNADEINIGFTPDNRPIVIYRGLSSGFKLYVKQYVTPNWIDVGLPYTPILTPSKPYVAIANDGTPYITFADNGVSNYVLVKKFNTTTSNWDDISSSTISSGITQLGGLVVIDGIPYVAFRDQGTGFDIQVKRFNGSNWELVGNTIVATSGTDIIMKKTVSDVIYVSYKTNNRVTVKRLVGNDWVAVGSEGFSNSFMGEYDFDVNDNNNCAIIYKNDLNPKIEYFDGNTLTVGAIETGITFDIRAYPNPVLNTLNIETELSINDIVIYNELGQFVLETKSKTIDTSGLSSGLYFVKVQTDEGTSYRSIKIIKK